MLTFPQKPIQFMQQLKKKKKSRYKVKLLVSQCWFQEHRLHRLCWYSILMRCLQENATWHGSASQSQQRHKMHRNRHILFRVLMEIAGLDLQSVGDCSHHSFWTRVSSQDPKCLHATFLWASRLPPLVKHSKRLNKCALITICAII